MQFKSCFPIYKPSFAYISSFLTHINHCSRRLVMAVIDRQILLNMQNVTVSSSGLHWSSSITGHLTVLVILLCPQCQSFYTPSHCASYMQNSCAATLHRPCFIYLVNQCSYWNLWDMVHNLRSFLCAMSWLRFFRAFSSVVRQMPGYNSPRQGTASILPKFLCCSTYCLFCVILCIVCV